MKVIHALQVAVAALALLAFPTVLLVSGQVRTDQIEARCRQDQKQWTSIHRVIEAAIAPNPAGTSLDRLVVPADTPASVIEILRQLTIAESRPTSGDAVLKALGPRPTC